ncbi:Transient-receptor-potential-like protein [Papilio machaon]|uniref:Transient-receptor-potential-like protein n=1 Tax=Papilio machaon TaxID=76193 RepID=A0A0N0PEU5_PAPMA|nr:Transient-receptor-potential-like protein [Papilio machaon]
MVGLENFELAGIKSYTRFWGLLMFESYSVINVIVLLNLLIAMMSNSYAMIDEHSDVEWKFARTRLWMSYFDEGATLPPPFNIFPTPKLICKLLGLRKKDKMRSMKMKEQKEKELDVRYAAVMRALVWRYVSAMHRKMDDDPVTEDDINELKGDVSSLRYELLEVFEKNGMDVSFTDRKEKTVLAKRMKIWERRLMKDFKVAPVPPVDDEEKPEHETALSRFRRIAKMAVASTSTAMWDRTLAGAGISTQIGRCRTRQSFKNQQNLQKAMDEARKFVMRSPLPELSSITATSQTTEDILKAAKKKAPDAPKSPNHQADLEVMSTLAIARPVAPEIKPAEGALPAPIPPSLEIVPSSPSLRSVALPTPKKNPCTEKTAPPRPMSPRTSSPQSDCNKTCPASPPSPKRHSSTSSTEQLIPSPGYKTLRPINKIDEVKTIKRQTKTGWL